MSLRGIAQETLGLLEKGVYHSRSGLTVDIASVQELCVQRSKLYRPHDFPTGLEGAEPSACQARVSIVSARTTEAAHKMSGEGDLALLNFASGCNPGGGFLKGAKAQEEDLCRCSGLYPCLLMHPEYYAANRSCQSLLYTDHLIYSPGVPFFKTKGRGAYLDEPYLCSVLTAPAPNAAELRKRPDCFQELSLAFRRRWAMVLEVASSNGHRRLVLGAWGCGAFGNQPATSAEAIRLVLNTRRFAGQFDEVVFAIPDRGKRSSFNYSEFRRVFGL